MNFHDDMPTKCHGCPYWEIAEMPYVCDSCKEFMQPRDYESCLDAMPKKWLPFDRWAELKEDIQELHDNNQDKQDVSTVLHFILNLMDVKEKRPSGY